MESLADVKPAKALRCIAWYREHLDSATLICLLELWEALVYLALVHALFCKSQKQIAAGR